MSDQAGLAGKLPSLVVWKRGSRFVALAILLCIVAALPYGCATEWAKALVGLLAFGTGVCGLLSGGALSARGRTGKAVLLVWLALAGWLVFQLIPLSTGFLSFLEPFSRETYRVLAGNGAGAMSLAVNGYDSLFDSAFWLAVFVLVIGTSAGLSAGSDRIAFAIGLVVFGSAEALFGLLTRDATWWAGNEFVGTRAIGTFSSGNSFGGFLLLTVALNVGLIMLYGVRSDLRLRTRSWLILVLLVALSVQCVALIMSASRGAIVSTCLSVGLLLGWVAKSGNMVVNRSTIRWISAVLVLGLVVGLGGGYGYVYNRFGLGTSGGTDSIIDLSRLEIWKGALLLVVHHPMGVGIGGFGEGILQWMPSFGDSRAYYAHSDILQSLCELGIPGFVLLILGCVQMVRAVGSRLKDESSDPLALLRMGAVAGIVGSLIHAMWEFNLSSRPGVLIPFLLLLGLSLSGAVCQSSVEGPVKPQVDVSSVTEALPPRVVSRPNWIAVAAVLLAGIVAVPVLLRAGIVAVVTESARVALGAKPDNYFWLMLPASSNDKGQQLLNLAARLAPDSSSAQFMKGYGRVMAFNAASELAVNSNVELIPGNKVLPDQVRETVRLALRTDEIDAYRFALPSFKRAAKLAPRIADYYTDLARACAELSVAEVAGPSGGAWTDQMLGAVECACALAPDDRPTCVRICRALAAGIEGLRDPVRTPELQSIMLDYGGRALRHNRALPDDLLASFVRAGIPFSSVLAIPGLPLETMHRIYKTVDNVYSADRAVECLDVLGRLLDQTVKTGHLSSKEEARLEGRKRFHIGETAKWMCRTGRWKDYHDFSDARWRSYESGMRETLSGIESATGISRQVKRLKLRQVRDDFGLDESRLLDLVRLEFECGDIGIARELFAEAAVARTPYPEEMLSKFLDANPVMSCLTPGYSIAKARVAMKDGDLDSAVVILKDCLQQYDDMLRFNAQVYRLLASSYMFMDRPQVARKFAADGLGICSTDTDLLRIVTEVPGDEILVMLPGGLMEPAGKVMSYLTPDCRIGTRFRGGAVVLEGLSCHKSETSGGEKLAVRASWRFSGSVPSDLVARTWLIEGGKTSPSLSKSIPFRQAAGTQFLAGRPIAGCTTVTELEIPRFMIADTTLVCVGLQRESSSRLIPSVEGMQSVQLLGSTVLKLVDESSR